MYDRYRREVGGAGGEATQETLLHAAKADRMRARKWVLVLRTHEDVLRTVVRPEDSLRVRFLCELGDRMGRLVALNKRCKRLTETADNAMAADRILLSEQAAQAAEALVRAVRLHVKWLHEWLVEQVRAGQARVMPGPKAIRAAIGAARHGDAIKISDAGLTLADPEMGRVGVAVEFAPWAQVMWPLTVHWAEALEGELEKLLSE